MSIRSELQAKRAELAPSRAHLESTIQDQIREALGTEPDLVLWRNNVGVAQHFSEHTHQVMRVRYGLVDGSADLVGMLTLTIAGVRVARFFCLETKQKRGRYEVGQREFGALVRERGGFCATVRSVDEARTALARARRGALE